ncbi:antennal-specific protein OS-C [Anastrepha obliqua]|uniref:antennal-specific protein OS-C n=1 Tax=Anastrepha obliqua TaxID=95512 RepID=UPI00240A08F3|nr:antennal-specific protein OS-C [Anastrepha obliqua]
MLHSGRSLVLLGLILSLMAFLITAEADNAAPPSEEDDNSSSEETVEDSNESRPKRSLEATSGENTNKGGDGKLAGKAGIPGLPDPTTILKIVEILQTLGEKVVPILVEAIG